jgi:hypothetical protein
MEIVPFLETIEYKQFFWLINQKNNLESIANE